MKKKIKAEDTPSVPRGNLSDERYIKALEESNKTLNSENRRLVNMLISQLNKREKEADKCAKCLLKDKKI
ncbi:MAG: hypothetical protein LBO74_08710 [Candidatus Symbiothrix sp.]|jgi:hypothetical protein|nr:hypothetical protein [Candidatus Symbiothrix sp.]